MISTDAPVSSDVLMQVSGVSKIYAQRPDALGRLLQRLGVPVCDHQVTAVDNVHLTIARGEVLGLVGESGCGKSTLGRIMAGLRAPSSGAVFHAGQRIDAGHVAISAREQLKVQMVFQDPMASLDPRQRIGDLIAEGAVCHRIWSAREAPERVASLLAEVGLDPSHAQRYPHQFSGGQRQRIGIARALSVEPEVLICDEPVAALDVSIQAQILNLLMELRRKRGLTCLFISHDLGVVRHVCDRVAVMYLGHLVELAPARSIFALAQHPYTRALMAEVPSLGRGRRQFSPLAGEIPSPLHPPEGCPFHPRCIHATSQCKSQRPALLDTTDSHLVACYHPVRTG